MKRPQPKPAARAHVPTEHSRMLVRLHASIGTEQPIIAAILGISDRTLRKHYRRELDLALAEANAVIGGALFNKAKSGDTASMIFWMKTRAGWREIVRPDRPPTDEEIVIVRDYGGGEG